MQAIFDDHKKTKELTPLEKLVELAGRRVSVERQFGIDVKSRHYPLNFVQSGFTSLLAQYRQEHEIMLELLGGDLREQIEFAADEKLRSKFGGSFAKYKHSLRG
jgi:hypothetical protein